MPALSRTAIPPSRSLAAIFLLALGLAAGTAQPRPASAGSWADGSFDAGSELQLVTLTNRSRAADGQGPLRVDPELTGIARWRSQDMALRGYFSHSIPPGGGRVFEVIQGKGYCFSLAGENIGWNTYSDDIATEQIHQAFLDSPGHRANIVADPWQAIGVGAYKGPDGKKVWTVLFADPCEAPRLAAGS
jgi:uncharacterized protein YkwD